jgi:4,5-dihydroxyphthalate decarboxylase
MLSLQASFSDNARLVPLLDGTVQIPGVEIHWQTGGSPGEWFARHLRDNEFDLFEMSISDYMNIRSRDNVPWDWTAIPVFLSKGLLALNTWVRVDSGIADAGDLKGKRLAVGDYTQTAFLWFRAMIDRLHGVKSQDIAWYNARAGEHSHTTLLGLKDNPPPGVSITFLDRPEAANDLLQAGEIHAACATSIPIDTGSPTVQRLFPDRGRSFVEAYFRAVGHTPVNHTVAMQRRLAEENPWLPEALFEAFERSKQEAYRRDPSARWVFGHSEADWAATWATHAGDPPSWQESVFGPDPYPTGLAANRGMLTTAAEQSFKDRLAQRPIEVEQLFAEGVRGT